MDNDRSGCAVHVVRSSEAFEDSPAFLLSADAIDECWRDAPSRPALGVGRPVLCVEDGGVPVAFLVYALEPQSRLLWLDFIYVERSHRRKGLGKALLAELIDIAEQLRVRWVACEVHVGNNSMIDCLKSFGFAFEPDQESYLLAARAPLNSTSVPPEETSAGASGVAPKRPAG